MARVEHSVIVNAPIEKVWDVAARASGLPNWFANVTDVSYVHDTPVPDAEMKLKYNVSGLNMDITARVGDFSEPTHLVMHLSGGINGTSTLDFLPSGNGTKVTQVFEYTLPGGGLGAIADKLIVERMNEANAKKSLESLKKLVED